MNILALDTATEACSVALSVNGKVARRGAEEPRGHARLLLSMVDELLTEFSVSLCDLDAIAFGRGPGAFTGLRIAAAAAQGLAVGQGLPVLPISNLAALAQGAWRREKCSQVVSAIDARMGEVYWAAWRCSDSGVESLVCEQVGTPEQVVWPEAPFGQSPWHAVGTGWSVYEQSLLATTDSVPLSIDGKALPDAIDILALAEIAWKAGLAVPPELALPVYLRNNVAIVGKPKPL